MDDVEIDSYNTYDFRRARLSVALKWILSTAFGPDIPHELREPLPLKDKDTVTAIYVNTGMVSLLVNSRLYTQACNNLFPHLASSWKSGGHWSVIQGLSRLSIYVEDDDGQAITERDLVQTNPFHLTAHVALIEAIMAAYTYSVATTDKIVQAVKAIGPFNASDDLPIDCEDGLLVWMNKVTTACVKHVQVLRQHHLSNIDHSPRLRVNKKQLAEVSGHVPSIDMMEDILKDITDGCSLAALISFYCPNQLKFSDIHIAKPVGIGDSLHNISLIKTFCDTHLPVRIFHFTYEDVLYSTDTIKPGLLAFLAQLLHDFTIIPLDIVSTPHISTSNNNQGIKTISPSPTTKSSHQVARPLHLISEVTKKSFQPQPPSSSAASRLSNDAEHYDSNPSLSTSSSNRLLQRRPSQGVESSTDVNMHDTLSPIVVRKSQSMGILDTPDPKQSLVAWESKSYYVDRSKNSAPTRVSTTSNGSASLLSNVSFHEGSDDEDMPATSADLNSVNSAKDVQRRHNNNNTHTLDRPKSGASLMSHSYQKLLDRSSDLESPLKLFAQKHGFQLAEKPEPPAAASEDQPSSPSPVDVTSSELTKVTPRSDSEHSPRQHAVADGRSLGQSYVISTATTEGGAQAAGLPVITDSCTDVTFTSLTDTEDSDKRSGSPIQPIDISNDSSGTQAGHRQLNDDSVTNFVNMSLPKNPAALTSPNVSSSTGGLKQRFQHQKNNLLDAKPSKKATFSLNQTTWSDHAKANSEIDSDSVSESSEASVTERGQFSDVRILLEEKRKAMEKKKTLEEMERTKELNAASRQAFLKAVSKNKNNANHDNRSSEALKAFSRNDISKSIENLQSKWQQDEKNNAKRAAATTSAKTINVTPASLDNITEVSESSEAETPKVALPSATPGEKEAEVRERRSSSVDLHEAPVDVEQYGLDKLNASLSELRGEMKRLSTEQRRIEELQNVMNITRPQSRSTPHSKHPSESLSTAPETPQSKADKSAHGTSSSLSDPTLRLSDLDNSSPRIDNYSLLSQPDTSSAERSDSISKSYHGQSDVFSHPNVQSMSQSTDQPFILHNTPPPSTNKRRNRTNEDEDQPTVSSPKSTPRNGSLTRTNSNGFLSSSQLSRKKANAASKEPADSPSDPANSLSQSAGRRKWTPNNAPLFPGYDDEDARSKVREPDVATQDRQPIFQPPPDNEVKAPRRTSQKSRKSLGRVSQSDSGSPVNGRGRLPSDTLEVRQLPGHSLPSELSQPNSAILHHSQQNRLASESYLQDTPMRDARWGGTEHRHGEQVPSNHSLQTPMGDVRQRVVTDISPLDSGKLDTPMRTYQQGDMNRRLMNDQFAMDNSMDTPMRQPDPFSQEYDGNSHPQADISGVTTLDGSLIQPGGYPHNPSLTASTTPHPYAALNSSIDTPMRQQQPYNRQTDDLLDTPMRRNPASGEPIDTPMMAARRPQSMIESVNRDHLHNASIDTPMREAMRMNSNQIFYSPPTRHRSESMDHHNQTSHLHNASNTFTDTPMGQPPAVSRYGTSTLTPQASSRHGTINTDQSMGSSDGANRLVRAPYEHEPEPDKPASSTRGAYKLQTPYGNADNELKPAETNVSLSSAIDAIRTDMIKYQSDEPATSSNLAFGAPQSRSSFSQPPQAAQVGYQPHSYPTQGQAQEMDRKLSSASSDMESAFADIGSIHAQTPVRGSRSNSVHTEPSLVRQTSAENDDKASVHSYGSGSAESGEGTPRGSTKPKRATWDMSTPRGDLLNQPGVGFIVAEQAQLSEEELRKRKEKVLMMQMKRREDQELKKQQKAADLAAKAELARMKDQETEKRKIEEKIKKEAILQQFQSRKAEEDLPPEMRAQFRQKRKRANERPASIHWAGTSTDENLLRGSDIIDSASSFTISMGSGNLTHRRPASPASSSAAGGLSSRSKAPSRGALEAPPDEYTGPKLYVKPSQKQKSNRTIIINAVSHCCLAGVVNTDNKNKVLEEIARSDGKHFLILFRDGNQTYKAVYSYCPDSEECTKVHGQGPKFIKDDMCHRFYKYNSGGKKFTEVLSTKHLSVSIDAITIHNHLWQKKAAAASLRR